MRSSTLGWWSLLVLGAACSGTLSESAPAPTGAAGDVEQALELEEESRSVVGGFGGARDGAKKRARAESAPAAAAPPPAEPAADVPLAEEDNRAKDQEGEGGGGGAAARAWFPETFLWEPLVRTDESGQALVQVRAPDALTTWEILAHAHDRAGGQAGAVHRFATQLPISIEPLLPSALTLGDQVMLPLQVSNRLDQGGTFELRLRASGAADLDLRRPLEVGPGASALAAFSVLVEEDGWLELDLGVDGALGQDRMKRQVRVRPVGRPWIQERAGVLAEGRSLPLLPAAGADPASQRLRVEVWPGPLALLQGEVERASAGSGSGTYLLHLRSRLADLARATGTPVDPALARRLELLGWQRIAASARTLEPGRSADLLAALPVEADQELLRALRARAEQQLRGEQRGDGTFSRTPNATLQRVLAETAWSARVVRDDAPGGVKARARGAIERFASEIRDPYTAGLVLAAGLAPEGRRAELETRVLEAITVHPDGSVQLALPAGVVDPWGARPDRASQLAVACLALAGRSDAAARGDLIGQLVATAAAGTLGGGPADPLVLDALLEGLAALDQAVEVVVRQDGVERGRATLDPQQPMRSAVLEVGAATLAGWSVAVEPAVPGLAWRATTTSYLPWTGQERLAGVDVEVRADGLQAGRRGVVQLTLAGPDGLPAEVELGLAPGAQVDAAALQAALVATGLASEVTSLGDRVRLRTRPLVAGSPLVLPIPVEPALAGRFTPPSTRVTVGGSSADLPPVTWVVGG